MVKITVERDGELMYEEESRLAVVNLQGLKDDEDLNMLNIIGEGPGKLGVFMKLISHIVKSVLDDNKGNPLAQGLAMKGILHAVTTTLEKYESTQADDADEDALENKPIPLYRS